MDEPHTLDAFSGSPQHIEAQLEEVEERLVQTYGASVADEVHEQVQEQKDRFADARVTAFVPILIERAVRENLGDPPAGP
jgi:hypothetical protein